MKLTEYEKAMLIQILKEHKSERLKDLDQLVNFETVLTMVKQAQIADDLIKKVSNS